MRTIPQQAIELVEKFEGLSLKRYNDADGHATIGYGHLCSKLDVWDIITEDQALDLLLQDLQSSAEAVMRLTTIPLNDNQYSALIDFVFNMGAGTYQASTLRRTINRQDFDEVPNQFSRWIYGNSQKLPGLIFRRHAESQLFMM